MRAKSPFCVRPRCVRVWTSENKFPASKLCFAFIRRQVAFHFKSASSLPLPLSLHTINSLFIFSLLPFNTRSPTQNSKMKYFSLTAIVLAATIINAQTPDACIVNCTLASCSSVTDFTCVCGSAGAAILACLKANCTAAELATALQLDKTYCCKTLSLN